ncbi:MAG: alpha-galactosidase [Verrucomicrobia bacterium]|nr:alpha-galactosidase [Verrucomicrobiota bacterium]
MKHQWLLIVACGWAATAWSASPDWLLDPSPYTARITASANGRELVLENGLLRRVIRVQPNAATVALDHLGSGESLLRGVKPEAVVELDGRRFEVGGLRGQSNYAFLRPEWIPRLGADTNAFRFIGHVAGRPEERLAWRRMRHHAPDVQWPPKGVTLRLDFAAPESAAGTPAAAVRVSVHYELYDGLPAYSKWITVTQTGNDPVRLDRFSSEMLAWVERSSEVDELSDGAIPPNVHVETDMSFGGMMAAGANRRSYRWLPDPDFHTQVNYEKRTPCLLEIGPDLGPAQALQPGVPWESYRAWVLPMDSTDRERCGLSVRRLYRVIAPWTTENPLMMHLVSSDGAAVTNAIEQCAAVGFEMLILSFGSGFHMEDESPRTLEQARAFASHARQKGIEIGSYSLLSSRSIGADQDVVMPPGKKPVFGNAPCLQSVWGTNYFRRLHEFHRESGFALLEHDGSYPGDPCASTVHPGHRGLEDSRWNQWREIADFYGWCRGQGIYLNVPDYYFLSGSSKVAMGYREVNWSLPRDEQVIHTRQNIYDGTWQKLPSMGWMFVPLTEYHGGGAAATIEPLEQHLDHYARMLDCNLALGVQACYRGPRLYDSERTRELVASKVAWFKAHRELLESDLIHGRRADARNLDWMLHVNPRLPQKGLLAVFNPTDQLIGRTLRLSLYYTGLTGRTTVRDARGREDSLPISPDGHLELPVVVPPQGMSTYVFE